MSTSESASVAAISHPRLFFSAHDVSAIVARCRSGLCARVWQHMILDCDHAVDPKHPAYLDYREQASDDWRHRHGMFRIFPTLQQLASGYALTGNRAYGEAARDAVLTIIEQKLADARGQAWGESYAGWRHAPGHDKGKLAWAFAWVFDFCHDLFSAEQRRQFVDFAEETIAMNLANKETWRFDNAQVTNNRGVRALNSLALWGLACEGEPGFTRDIEALIRTGQRAMERYLHMAFDADGAPYEGAGYGSVLGLVAQMGHILHRRGGSDLSHSNRHDRYLEYLLYELIPGGGSVNNLNDCDLPAGSVAGSLQLMGTPRGALIPWLAQQLDLHPTRVANGLDADPGVATISDVDLPWLLWWDESQPLRTPAELGYPHSHRFLTRGVASHRSGWQSDDWLVTHFCGREEILCHRQGDHNHVTFWIGDDLILADPGYGAMSPTYQRKYTEAVDRYYAASDVHNVVLFNGQCQHTVVQSPGWSEGVLLDFEIDDRFSASLGDAASCTGPNHSVRRSLRRVVCVPRRFLAVIDLNELDGGAFDLDVQWQTRPGQRIELADDGFIIHSTAHRCRAWTWSPSPLEATLLETHDFPQVRYRTHAAVSEIVTVFSPDARQVAVRREGEGDYAITVDGVTVRAIAAVTMPLRKPIPTSMQ